MLNWVIQYLYYQYTEISKKGYIVRFPPNMHIFEQPNIKKSVEEVVRWWFKFNLLDSTDKILNKSMYAEHTDDNSIYKWLIYYYKMVNIQAPDMTPNALIDEDYTYFLFTYYLYDACNKNPGCNTFKFVDTGSEGLGVRHADHSSITTINKDNITTINKDNITTTINNLGNDIIKMSSDGIQQNENIKINIYNRIIQILSAISSKINIEKV
jgi:hypothetical protein